MPCSRVNAGAQARRSACAIFTPHIQERFRKIPEANLIIDFMPAAIPAK